MTALTRRWRRGTPGDSVPMPADKRAYLEAGGTEESWHGSRGWTKLNRIKQRWVYFDGVPHTIEDVARLGGLTRKQVENRVYDALQRGWPLTRQLICRPPRTKAVDFL